jgi:hypothetical protein
MTTTKPGAYTWTRKTYQSHADVVASLIRKNVIGEQWQTITVEDLVKALGDMYQIDNPRFDRERFDKACMKGGLNG